MIHFTRRNVAILALLQIGVIIAGVLAAALLLKIHVEFRAFNAEAARLWTDYGLFTLIVPIAWGIVAHVALEQESWPDVVKEVVFCSGFIVLLVLIYSFWSSVGSQLSRLITG